MPKFEKPIFAFLGGFITFAFYIIGSDVYRWREINKQITNRR